MARKPSAPILGLRERRKLQTALDRRAQAIADSQFAQTMQGILTDDGMIAGEAIHWDPSDPTSVGGTLGGALGGSLPNPTIVARYRQFVWEADGAGGWGFVEEDDGTGQMVPVTELWSLE